MGSLCSESGRTLVCDKCGTTDFAVARRPFDMAFICPECVLVMCSSCAGRDRSQEIVLVCCYNCGSTGIRIAEIWADRLAWSSKYVKNSGEQSISGT